MTSKKKVCLINKLKDSPIFKKLYENTQGKDQEDIF